jgi:hypothetical protein
MASVVGQAIGQGLCGRLVCQRLCLRSEHCPAGRRRADQLLARQAIRRFSVCLDRRRGHICEQVHDSGLCPSLCQKVGGCFLPQVGDHPSEAKCKVFRAQRAIDALVRARSLSLGRK